MELMAQLRLKLGVPAAVIGANATTDSTITTTLGFSAAHKLLEIQ